MPTLLELLTFAIIALGQILLTLKNYRSQGQAGADGATVLLGLLFIPTFLGAIANWFVAKRVPASCPLTRVGISAGLAVLVQAIAVGLAFNLYGS